MLPSGVRSNDKSQSCSCCKCSSRTSHIAMMAALIILGLGLTTLGAAIASGGIKQVSFKPGAAIGFLLTSNALTCFAVAYMILGGKSETTVVKEKPNTPNTDQSKPNWYVQS